MSTKHHKGLEFGLLYDEATIKKTIARLAGEINDYYAQIKQKEGDIELLVVCVLKGAFMFYSDLIRLLEHVHTNQFIKIKSYSGLQSTGTISVQPALEPADFAGKHVLIVEDMHDTGTTLKKLTQLLEGLKPKKVDAVVLIKRPDRPVQIDLKFWGLQCGDFIIGYGLDFDEFGRSFPAIYQKL